MNCKPGDLAVIVRPGTTSRNLGKFVLVDRLFSDSEWHVTALCPLHKNNGRFEVTGTIEDSRLRPIRDNPGQDETLTWKDVPSTTKEAA